MGGPEPGGAIYAGTFLAPPQRWFTPLDLNKGTPQPQTGGAKEEGVRPQAARGGKLRRGGGHLKPTTETSL